MPTTALGHRCELAALVALTGRFLVQDGTKAILHTGDVRADNTFRQALRRSTQLQGFFPPSSKPAVRSGLSATRQLNRIYLDTSAL